MKNTLPIFDPVKTDLERLEENLKGMIAPRHPILYAAAEHLFKAGGKRVRPAIILLVAKASSKCTHRSAQITPSQKRLAEIMEIIHTASLVHDDVLDEGDTRRGVHTVHYSYNAKVAVLAGDFLLAQSSWYLANLNNLEVVKTISKVITDFAEGEIRQGYSQFDLNFSISDYIEKSFYKTASLIAASCRAVALLSIDNHSNTNTTNRSITMNCYNYGKYLGLAFQIIDDILDIISSEHKLGKPAASDLKSGHLTAPVLFAARTQPHLTYLIEREFTNLQDLQLGICLIYKGQGIEQAKDLAAEYLQAAINSLKPLPPSEDKHSLLNLTNYILQRLS